ncbi:MAG: lipid-A-disaccharide synthase N-terminal domain-containing protein [Deltaproteobacteria bacterium]|nr:lipid-A-disaccharide synthase N-terminal domain-containing protein [Deltaproteobacteria bacterium]
MNGWVILGFVGQATFFMRFLFQWIVSEKKGESFIPIYFWYLSISGGLILLAYAIHIGDPIFTLGQSCGLIVYVRNLMLIYRNSKKVIQNQSIS